MAKSRISRKEANALYEAKRLIAEFRDVAERGDVEASRIVRDARETRDRLTAKRNNKIWL